MKSIILVSARAFKAGESCSHAFLNQSVFLARWILPNGSESPDDLQSETNNRASSIPPLTGAKVKAETTPESLGTKKSKNRRLLVALLLLFSVAVLIFFGLAIAFTLSQPGEKRQAAPEATQGSAPVPSNNTPASVSEQAATVVPPSYKIAHQDCKSPTPFIVAADASDAQVTSLLWEIRGEIRSHAYYDLGLHDPNQCNSQYRAGMIEVFRGTKCAAETYTETKLPCGEGDHEAGSYQWGLGSSNDQDEGYLYSQDRIPYLIFNAETGDALPNNIRSLIEQKSQARKLNQQILIKIMNDASQNSSFSVHYFPGQDENDLWVRSDLFEDESNRNAFLSLTLRQLKTSMCKAGFTTISLMPNSLFSSKDAYWLGC